MALTLETVARNAAADGVVDLLDGGTLELQTSGDVEVATLSFGTPAFGDAAVGVATANAIADDTNATGGTAAKFVAKTSGGAAVFEGSVGATGSGEDIELSSTSIASGETVEITSLTYTQPAS
jgi:hypothetical protein